MKYDCKMLKDDKLLSPWYQDVIEWGKIALVRFKRAARDSNLKPTVLDADVFLPSTINLDSSEMTLRGWIEHYGKQTNKGHYIAFRTIGNNLWKFDDTIVRVVDKRLHRTSTAVTILLYIKK